MELIRGAIIAESLRPGTVLEGDGMVIISWRRYDVRNVPDYQSPVWTLIEFEALASTAAALAEKLSAALLERGWYANWNSDTEATVVFPGRIFRYARGDRDGRAAAQEHGRRCGVPEPQLDWGD